MSTFMANKNTVDRKWYILDAANKPLGRTAAQAAVLLRGKHKADFTPHVDCGDFVIVVNAAKIQVTGKKLDQKIYFRHSEYVGGAKYTTLRHMLATKPERVVEHAIRGMIPHGALGDKVYKKLHVYAGPEHEHAAQKPEALTLKY